MADCTSTTSESTYQRLFSAAKSPPPAAYPTVTQVVHARPQPNQRQPSLHNFWTISSPPPSAIEPVMESTATSTSLCEDCEVPLPMPDNDISMGGMDEDDVRIFECACRSCGRRICGTCAIVEVGVGRECLQCRTSPRRKKWIGGIGWMS